MFLKQMNLYSKILIRLRFLSCPGALSPASLAIIQVGMAIIDAAGQACRAAILSIISTAPCIDSPQWF